MNRAALLTWVLVAFLSGVFLGVIAGRRSTTPPEGSPTSGSGTPRRDPGNATTGWSSLAKSGAKESQEENSRLRQRIASLEGRLGTVPPSEDEAKTADEIYKHLKNPRIDEDPKGFMRATGLLADLRPTMTPLFARKFRAAKPQFDSVALELAVASGGPEAASLLKEILGSSSLRKAERVGVGISLTGEGYLLKVSPSIPVDPELANLGVSALALVDPYERLAGVGILALQGTDQSRAALQSLAVQDKDEPIRIAAISALGRMGDRSTLGYLQSYTLSSFPDLSEESDLADGKPPSTRRALLLALRQLSQRFPD